CGDAVRTLACSAREKRRGPGRFVPGRGRFAEKAPGGEVVLPGASYFSIGLPAAALQPAQDVLGVDLQQRVGVVVPGFAPLAALIGFELPEESLEVPPGSPLRRPEACERFAGRIEHLPEAAADPGVRDPCELAAGLVEIAPDHGQCGGGVVERCRGAGRYQCVDLPTADRVEVDSLYVLQYIDDGVRHVLGGYRERGDSGATEHPRTRRCRQPR